MNEDKNKIVSSDDFDFESELKINKYKLDEECLSHSSRYAYWAEAYALARSELALAKDNLSYIISMRSMAIRNMYNEAREKTTEARLQAAIEIDDEVLEARSKVRKAEDVANKMLVAVNAMDVRKSELDNLVKLYCSGYFSNTMSNVNKKDVTENVAMDIRKNLNKGDE